MGDQEVTIRHLAFRQSAGSNQVGAIGCIQAAAVNADEAKRQEQGDKSEEY
jgi:hypothetical protein